MEDGNNCSVFEEVYCSGTFGSLNLAKNLYDFKVIQQTLPNLFSFMLCLRNFLIMFLNEPIFPMVKNTII